MKQKYHIDEEDIWLVKMYKLRKHWVNAYQKDIFYTGMTTSQRSESINSFFDGFVNANTKLVEFVHQYDKVVAARHELISRRLLVFELCANCISNLYDIQLMKFYTRKIF